MATSRAGNPLPSKPVCGVIPKFAADPLPDLNVSSAPALASFGQRWPLENLEEALAEGISVSHDNMTMPEFSFTPESIADLLTYMENLPREANAKEGI